MTVAHAAGVREDCYSCVRNASLDALPPRERILLGPGWRVVHAIRAALPGWLVVVARRHVTSPAELTAAEASELGLVTWRLSRALIDVTGCAKTYVVAFSEAEGFTHLHVHVIPWAADLPVAERGPAVFSYLRRPPAEWVSPDTMDSLAQALAISLASIS
ncbi:MULTISPECIES: HIT family protein [Protofrankia]|uniref:HIT family protein n=1 Tax=Protofrankia TaxID=2994361 RepID=UPI0005BC1A3E|nr:MULTISPECIES: HIT family protein [Protofrankia]